MTHESQDMLAKLEKLDWFHQCGKPIAERTVKQVESWNEAFRICQSRDTENVQLESSNLLTEKLCFTFPERYHGKWNPLIVKVKKKTEPIVIKKVQTSPHCPKLLKRVLGAIRWDLLMIVME